MKKTNSENVSTPQSRSFERRIYAQTQDLQIFKKFNMSQMNPKGSTPFKAECMVEANC